jgi:AcrR family transcriptional regulator
MQAENRPVSKSLNEKSAVTREKILDAASELFLEGGVAALSVRAISKRAGLSTIGIYSHFNGKQGVLDALYIDGFNKVYEAMSIGVSDEVAIDQVLQSCKSYLKVAYENEAHYRLIFGESDTGYEPSELAREAATRAFKKLVSNTEGYIKAMDLRIDRLAGALDIWAVMHGYVSISHHAMANEKLDWMGMASEAVERQIRSWAKVT